MNVFFLTAVIYMRPEILKCLLKRSTRPLIAPSRSLPALTNNYTAIRGYYVINPPYKPNGSVQLTGFMYIHMDLLPPINAIMSWVLYRPCYGS